jgi:transposase-like protein
MTQICREMSISWSLLDQWQNQAMEGMLTALSPKRPDPSKGLNPRLVQLIDKKLSGGNLVKLEKRLKTIQSKAN